METMLTSLFPLLIFKVMGGPSCMSPGTEYEIPRKEDLTYRSHSSTVNF
jgi:hypothetical protein